MTASFGNTLNQLHANHSYISDSLSAKRRLLTFWVFVFAFILTAPNFFFKQIKTGDLWWHLATGKMILETHSVPRVDSFSYTFANRPWTNHEWLSEVIFYDCYKYFGENSLAYLKIGVLLAGYTILFLGLWRTVRSPLLAYASGLCTLISSEPFLDVRPHIFTLFLTPVLLLLLTSMNRRSLFFLPPLMLLWVNLHSGAIFGFMVMGSFLLGHMATFFLSKKQAADGSLRSYIKTFFAMAVFSAAVSLINPSTHHVLTYPFEYLGHSIFKNIDEWRPPYAPGGLEVPGFFWSYAVLFLFSLVSSIKKGDYPLSLTSIMTFLMAMTSKRFVPLFMITSSYVTLVGLSAASRMFLGRVTSENVGTLSRINLYRDALYFASGALLLCGLGYKTFHLPFGHDMLRRTVAKDFFPQDTVEFIEMNHLQCRILNEDAMGGYLIWTLYPKLKVFIDQRADTLYDEKIYKDHSAIRWGEKPWEEIFSKYEFDTVLWLRDHEMYEKLSRDPGWKVLYSSAFYTLFVKLDRRGNHLFEEMRQGRLVFPDSAYADFSRGYEDYRAQGYESAIVKLKRAVQRDPELSPAYLVLAMAYIYSNNPEYALAESVLKKNLAFDPFSADRHWLLGNIYEERGDYMAALREYRKEIRINPSNVSVWGRYNQLLDRMPRRLLLRLWIPLVSFLK